MPITMGGLASGMNTDDIIDKLMKVESQPVMKLQIEKQEYSQKKGALKDMETVLRDLQKSAKELYGFRASYDEKKAISGNQAVIEALATSKAEKGISHITVSQLAGFHKIVTDNLDQGYEIPAGDFSIEVNKNKESIRFRGGNLEQFRDRIAEAAEKLVTPTVINTTGTKSVLSLESKVSGEKGEILITGNKDFLKKIGLVSGEKDANSERTAFIFDSKNFASYAGELKETESGSLTVSPEGKSFDMTGLLWREFVLPSDKELKKDTVLEFTPKYTSPEAPEKEEEVLPYKIEFGPEEKINIKGIELNSYNISRDRELDKKPPRKDFLNNVAGVGVVWYENGQRNEKRYTLQKDATGKQEIPVGSDLEGKKISRVIFYCNDGALSISNAALATPLKGKDLLEPKNVISKPTNAKLKIDGVDLERDRNDGIADIIKGVTLNLKSASPNEDVTIKIDNDIDKAVEKIRKFVDSYNKYLDIQNQMTKTGKSDKLGDFDKVKQDSGIFANDMTFMSLMNQLKTAVSDAYQSRIEKPIRIISDIGVSTGEINAAWESIKTGKLIINDSKLKEAIILNPEGVKNLFGTDNDGDNRTDSGLAFTVENILEPYVRPGKNIISSKISQQDDSIKNADERIARLQDHLKSYEEKLRKKFASMEKSISGAKSQKEWMNQQMGSGQ